LLFTFGEQAIIPGDTYFVVAENMESFGTVFTEEITVFGNLASSLDGNLDDSLSGQPQVKLWSTAGTLISSATITGNGGWPVLPEEGYSLELQNITANPEQGENWALSWNIYGTPGLPVGENYIFHPPKGKDTVFSNSDEQLIRLQSSDNYYYDPDGHALAAIQILIVNGPGQTFMGGQAVKGDIVCGPCDLTFVPAPGDDSQTDVLYRFIDCSGQAGLLHTIRFVKSTGSVQAESASLKQYPNPVKDLCTIEFDREEEGPCRFTLTDVTGKIIVSTTSYPAGGKLTVDLSGVHPGLYIYSVYTEHRFYCGKIEVSR
ncbi:MAG: T9SS type A sorting domain-containing protein, partial [Bacteroidales bacterium]|nr:T9SS type A sorting domain-containing protein [Bacteroidales bacterium]